MSRPIQFVADRQDCGDSVRRFYRWDATRPSYPQPSGSPLPERFLSRLAGFADLFTRPTWSHVLLLLAGAILAPGRRTVTAALRILGRERDPDFCTFHRILNRAAWSSRAAAGRLLLLLINAFVPSGAPVVIGLDDTIERRWGPKISARGIYRDPVRSSKGHFVKASGLRWLSAMLLVPVPWADRIMALPFLTLLAPSKRFYADKSRAPKTLLDWARQAALQIHRWLPDRYIVLVADSAFAAIEFLAAVRNHVCVVTRLRLDANLFDFPPPKRKGRGRPPIKGKRLKKLSAVLKIARSPGSATASVSGTAEPTASSRSLPAPRSGITAAWRQCRSAGCWSATPAASSTRKPSWHRSRCAPARHPRLVRQPLAGRGHLRGSPRPSRRRDPAPVVRPGDPAHHPGAARPVLHRHALDPRPRQGAKAQAENRRVVSKIHSHFQRRHRGSPPRNMGTSDFFHVAAAPRPCRNSTPYLAPNRKRARLRGLNWPKSSSGELRPGCETITQPSMPPPATTFTGAPASNNAMKLV